MNDTTKSILEKAWVRRAALLLLGQAHFDNALMAWTSTGELSAETANDKLRGERMKGLADRHWIRAVLRHAGNVRIQWRFNAYRSGYDCIVADGVVFEAIPENPPPTPAPVEASSGGTA